MLAIVNVTKDENAKIDDYEVRVNRQVLVGFQHKRKYNGAAQCLRDAADALENSRDEADAKALIALRRPTKDS